MDGARGATRDEDDGVVFGGIDGVADNVACFVPEESRLQGSYGRSRVRITVIRKNFLERKTFLRLLRRRDVPFVSEVI